MNNPRHIIILLAILALGFILRSYNLGFPSIGYHNMKENESLSIAQEMQARQDFLNKRVYFFNAFIDNPVIKNDPQPPLVAYQILAAWALLGENLWAPRLFGVVFGVLSVLLVYFISLFLFVDVRKALFCAFLSAIMPLGVFFSRNIQPESPGFFFMLLGNFLYLKFIFSRKKIHLFLGGIAFFLSWLYKFNFLIGILPVIFCFPFRSILKKKQAVKVSAGVLLPLMLIFIYFVLLKFAWQIKLKPNITGVFDIFHPAYWLNHANMILWYIKQENFTFLFSLLAACGTLLAFFKKEGLLSRYIIGWTASILVYMIIFPNEIYENSFSQMPFLGAVCIACAYAVSFISSEIKRFFKRDYLILAMILVTALSISGVYQSLTRMFGTVFLGEDVAGESLKEFTSGGERVFLLTHAQGYAIARYAQRYMGWPADLFEFKKLQDKYGVRFICIYPGDFFELLKKDSAVFDYVQKNYHVKEVGLIENPNRMGYLILEKGNPKGAKIEDALRSISSKVEPRSIYKVLGQYIFVYATRP